MQPLLQFGQLSELERSLRTERVDVLLYEVLEVCLLRCLLMRCLLLRCLLLRCLLLRQLRCQLLCLLLRQLLRHPLLARLLNLLLFTFLDRVPNDLVLLLGRQLLELLLCLRVQPLEVGHSKQGKLAVLTCLNLVAGGRLRLHSGRARL